MGRSLWWLAGAVVAVAAGVGVALWKAPSTVTVPPPEPGAEAPAESPQPMPAPPLRARQAAVPPGVTPDQWAAIAAEHAGRPAELARLADYLRFADTLSRWRERGPDRRTLAAELDATLDERLARREVTAGEARRIKAALLDDLLPDAPSRAAALKAWEAAQPGPSPELREAAARDAGFQQRQAAIVAAWRAQPEHLRDPKALERELDALRQATYPAPAR